MSVIDELNSLLREQFVTGYDFQGSKMDTLSENFDGVWSSPLSVCFIDVAI